MTSFFFGASVTETEPYRPITARLRRTLEGRIPISVGQAFTETHLPILDVIDHIEETLRRKSPRARRVTNAELSGRQATPVMPFPRETRAALWDLNRDTWVPSEARADVHASGISIERSRDSVGALVVGGPAFAWRVIMLPPGRTWLARRRTTATRNASFRHESLEVRLTTAADACLGYLESGALLEARDAALQTSEKALQGKVTDPIGAAAGAYVLLRTGALERLHDWTKNLANWFPWLPDGAVIAATHRLAIGEPAAAKDHLLAAAKRGVPIFAEGLKLLHQGLLLLSLDREFGDAEVAQALAWVTPYVQVGDPSSRLTTFFGANPAEPAGQPRVGPLEGGFSVS